MELLQPVLVLVVGYLLKLAFAALKVKIDEGAFNAILAGIVAYLLALLGVDAAARLLG